MNDATLTGRFTADPVLRETKTGKKVCSFDIAVKRRVPKNATEEQKKNDADFIHCVAWNEKAEKIAETGTKGRQILVKGAYHTNTNEKDGKVYKNTELWIDHYEFMDKNKPNKEGGEASDSPAPAGNANPQDVPL